jgi:hypothetical protein
MALDLNFLYDVNVIFNKTFYFILHIDIAIKYDYACRYSS